MRRIIILASDVIISGLLVMWFEWGRWLDLYGFTGQHPDSALDYFQGLVCLGSMLFAGLFVLLSIILAFVGSGSEAGGTHRLQRSFCGSGPALLGKYSALLVSVAVSPAFYFFMWRENVPRLVRSVGGFFMESIFFLLLLVMAERFITARAAKRRNANLLVANAKRGSA